MCTCFIRGEKSAHATPLEEKDKGISLGGGLLYFQNSLEMKTIHTWFTNRRLLAHVIPPVKLFSLCGGGGSSAYS